MNIYWQDWWKNQENASSWNVPRFGNDSSISFKSQQCLTWLLYQLDINQIDSNGCENVLIWIFIDKTGEKIKKMPVLEMFPVLGTSRLLIWKTEFVSFAHTH